MPQDFPQELETEVLKDMPESKTELSFIKAEAYHLSVAVENMKVTNREQYDKAAEVGIQNANILKRLEALRKALTMPLDLAKKRIMEQFKKATAIFEGNDEQIRKALEAYQSKVKTEPIKTVHTDAGRATVVERKDWEVESESEIPKKYWMLNTAQIGREVRAGAEIPGIKVITVKSTSFAAAK